MPRPAGSPGATSSKTRSNLRQIGGGEPRERRDYRKGNSRIIGLWDIHHMGHRDDGASRGKGRGDSRRRVLDGKALHWIDTKSPSGEQVRLGMGLALLHVVAHHHRVERIDGKGIEHFTGEPAP